MPVVSDPRVSTSTWSASVVTNPRSSAAATAASARSSGDTGGRAGRADRVAAAGSTVVAGSTVADHGAVGVFLHGVSSRAVVSQGCRPVGHEAVITRCEGNVVYELAGRRALERLRGEIAAARANTARPVAANLLVPFAREAHAQACEDAGVAVVTLFAGFAPDLKSIEQELLTKDATIRDVRPALVLLACTALFVLVIAWANAMNLVLVRSDRLPEQMTMRFGAAGERWIDSGLVFTSTIGTPT